MTDHVHNMFTRALCKRAAFSGNALIRLCEHTDASTNEPSGKRTALSGIGRTVGIIALVIVFIVALVTVLHGKAFEESFRVNRPLRSPPPPPHSPHSSRGHRYSLSAPASACTDFYDDVCSALLAKTPLPADRRAVD